MDGQYLGPTPETSPENIGLLSILSSIIDLQLFDVYTVWQGTFLGLKLLLNTQDKSMSGKNDIASFTEKNIFYLVLDS